MKLNTKKNLIIWPIFLAFLGTVYGVSWGRSAKQTQTTEVLIQQKVLGINTEAMRGEPLEPKSFLPVKKPRSKIELTGISAPSFSVIDEDSGIELIEKQPHKKLPIASLTKLMTVLLAYEKLEVNEYLTISKIDTLRVAPSLGLRAGDEIKILNLIEAALVCSANDAGKALANEVQKNEDKKFAELMNEKAKHMSLIETNFSNPLGFDSAENFSSVNDLKRLVKYTQKFAVFKNLGKKTGVNFNSKAGRALSCKTSNKLVGKNIEIENIKTGFTTLAKGSIIARVKREGINLIIFVVGSEAREKDLLLLSEIAFNSFVWR